MSKCGARVIVAMIAVVLVAGYPRAVDAKPPPLCTAGRFLVHGPSIFTGEASHDIEPVVLDGKTLAIVDACAAVRARLKRTKHGTVVTATWPHCDRFTGRVRVSGKIAAGCTTLTGTLKARKSKVKRTFTAVVSTCGDGIGDVVTGEQCEPPGSPGCTLRCEKTPLPLASITIDTPANLAVTSADAITVAGTVSPSVIAVACNGAAAALSNGSYSVSVPLSEGHNTIVCVASAADAGSATASVNVSRDSTGPRVGITSPKAAVSLTASPATVTGFVTIATDGSGVTTVPISAGAAADLVGGVTGSVVGAASVP